MEFTTIDRFLFCSLDLCSIDGFSITLSGIYNVIGENDVIDFSNNFKDEVIEEIYKNLSTIQHGTLQFYFDLLFKKIEDYKTNKDWKYYPHFKVEKLEHLEWQFQELLNECPENEELLQIGNFQTYITKENNKKRLLIVERLKREIEEIRDKFFKKDANEKIESLPETIQICNQRLKWKGTPGEFGAIFDKLFDTGFIDVIKDKKNMVRLLHSLFEIRNDKGEIVTTEYLYKCFKDKIKAYPPTEFKIPNTINYHNDQ